MQIHPVRVTAMMSKCNRICSAQECMSNVHLMVTHKLQNETKSTYSFTKFYLYQRMHLFLSYTKIT